VCVCVSLEFLRSRLPADLLEDLALLLGLCMIDGEVVCIAYWR